MTFVAVFVALVVAVSPAFTAKMGQRCDSDRDCYSTTMECIFRFEECTEKACWCKPDYGGRFSTSCRKVLTEGERCLEREFVTCPVEKNCDGIKDECVFARTPAGQQCDSPYTSCTDNAGCHFDQTTGKYTTCKCNPGYVEENGKCKTTQWGKSCSSDTCESYLDVYCTNNKCGCFNDSYTHKNVKHNGNEYDVCIPPGGATTDIGVGAACKLGDFSSDGQLCAESLTCSQCLLEEAPTCITPGGGADEVKAHVFCFTITLLLSKLLW